MAQKRANSGEGLSGRERKKLKMADARTIAVQPVQSNAEAGPSRVDSAHSQRLLVELFY